MLACTGKRDTFEVAPHRDRRQLLINSDQLSGMWDEGADGSGVSGCQLIIASCVSETVRTNDGKHTAYCLRCVMIGARGTNRKSWEVRRRYSEFHDLHTRMKALGTVHSDLPSKTPLAMMGAMVREKIERERERGLQEYLNAVLERCTDDQCLLLAKFLRVNKHIDSQSDAYSNGSGSPVPSFSSTNVTNASMHSQDAFEHASSSRRGGGVAGGKGGGDGGGPHDRLNTATELMQRQIIDGYKSRTTAARAETSVDTSVAEGGGHACGDWGGVWGCWGGWGSVRVRHKL